MSLLFYELWSVVESETPSNSCLNDLIYMSSGGCGSWHSVIATQRLR